MFLSHLVSISVAIAPQTRFREHSLYNDINILIKLALKFLSIVDYTLTGNFIDLRTGIIYVSLMQITNHDSYLIMIDLNSQSLLL